MEAIASLVTSAVLLLWQTCLNSPVTSYTMATISSYFGPGSGRRPDPEKVTVLLIQRILALAQKTPTEF
ncbi:hypothetical protein BFJ63_vAg18978 [Fusarium oxysporum f. sp. narcissi]|uniref:Secreted protein n=1 Tax=Fusarium oxysporum f. sp. narcissi TaxID=451672 RepID=A0A4Q2V0A3_FUSOX|nr:hypothetical protein BFJ63_vAg18978 [Fusarium oxysporum f. sp. narcissi]